MNGCAGNREFILPGWKRPQGVSSLVCVQHPPGDTAIIYAEPFSSREVSPHRPSAGWRVYSLLLLLAAELLGFTIRFDTQSLTRATPWWATWLGHAPALLHLGLTAVAAFLVIVGPRLAHVGTALRQPWPGHRWGLWSMGHLVVCGSFYFVTTLILDVETAAVRPSLLWPVAWLLSGTTTLILWLGAIAPLRAWWQFVHDESAALASACLAGVVAWGSSQVTEAFWSPLAGATFWVVRHLLSLLYADVHTQLADKLVGTSTFAVTIAPGCSGYEGIGLVTLLLAVYLWWFRAHLRFPQVLVLLPVGALVVWVANALRITLLVALGSSFSPAVAEGGFHSQAGWIAFLLVGLGMIAVTQKSRVFAAAPRSPSVPTHSQYAMALLVPLLVLMATMVLTSALASDVDWLYPLRVLTTGLALWYFRAVYRAMPWTWSWHAVGLGIAVFGLWMLLEPAAPPQTAATARLAQLSGGFGAVWLSLRVLGSVLTVPIAEELAFRGYLLHKLVAHDFETVRLGQCTWWACLVSSMVFGLLHGRWLAGTLAGIIYALALRRRGHLTDAIGAHMTTNALIALYVLWQGAWSLWL